MSRWLLRSFYGAELGQLSPCVVQHNMPRSTRLPPAPLEISILVHTGTRRHTSSSPPILTVSRFPCLTRLLSSSASLCHIYTSPLKQRLGSWDCRHHCSHHQWRTYAKKAKKSTQKLSEDDQDVINLDKVESSMEAAINALKYEYTNSIITRITPASLDKVSVEVDGESFQLKQVAQIGMPNPQTIIINMSSYPQAVESVVSALREAELNLNPIPEKNVIKVPIPKMTKELRENLVKLAKAAAEKCKVGIRKARQKAMSDLKKKSEVSKDSVKRLEKHIQELTDKHTGRIDELFKAKSAELLKGS